MSNSSSRWTRRRFLQASGATASAAGLLSSGVSIAGSEAKTSGQRGDDVYDAIIIGAGFAGATAARELGQRSLKTLVLEARNRIGGRTFTSEFSNHQVELGGTWVHWGQPHVWAEITRYGLHLKESVGAAPEQAAWMVGDDVNFGPGGEAWNLLVKGVNELCNVDGQLGRTVFPRPYQPFFNDNYRKYDHLSLQDRLDSIELTTEEKAVTNAMMSINTHNDPAKGAFIDMLRWYSLGEFDFGLLMDRLARFKIAEGTRHLVQAMLDDSGADVELSKAVTSVKQNAEGVLVADNQGNEYHAKSLIVTVPMNVLNKIDFEPALAKGKILAAQQDFANKGTKFYFKTRRKVGPYLAMAPHPYPITMLWTDQEDESGSIMVAFGPPSELDLYDPAQLQKAIEPLMPDVEIEDVITYQWTEDPYSEGTWCFFRPMQFSNVLEPLQTAEGRIHFASADSANGWRGFIDGAIERGMTVAQDVVNQLQPTMAKKEG